MSLTLVHLCSDPEFDDGLPLKCKCFRRVRLREAKKLVADGNAFWKKQKRADGREIELRGEIVLSCEKPFVNIRGERVYTRRHARLAQLITADNIEKAYVGQGMPAEHHAKRIEIHDQLAQGMLVGLGARLKGAEIIITVPLRGDTVTVEVQGVTGVACLELTRELEKAGEVVKRTLKPEFYRITPRKA